MSIFTTLIIPGYMGSEMTHWQSWIENQIPGSLRNHQEWDKPILSNWIGNICNFLEDSKYPVWVIAHSFGCLAAILAGLDYPDKMLGAMLVAPADPERFDLQGIKRWHEIGASESIRGILPTQPLPFPSLVVASSNDPWMQASKASLWANCWGSELVSLESAGHINTASGFGPWPEGLRLLNGFKSTNAYTTSISNIKREFNSEIA